MPSFTRMDTAAAISGSRVGVSRAARSKKIFRIPLYPIPRPVPARITPRIKEAMLSSLS